MIQLQVLNYILDKKEASILTANNITKDFFPDYKNEYDFIMNHINKYNTVPDKETFVATFQDFDFINVRESGEYLIDALYDDFNARKIATCLNNVRIDLQKEDSKSAENKLLSFASTFSQTSHFTCVDILKDTSRYDDYVARTTDFDKYYVKTGFKELDDIIGGWDKEEELATIAARTNTGKSWVLLKCAFAAAQQGLNVGIYSGEMSEKKVGYRLDTIISGISNSSIIHGDVSIQPAYKKYFETLSSQVKGSIKVLTPAMINGTAGVSALRAFIEREHLDMLCIDQHSLLEDDRKAKNPVERAANISKDLKNLQVLKKIPIIAVSQQNRTSTENGVGTEHIAQSDRIAQDSTIILFFEKDEDGIMDLNLVKSRDSVNGKKLRYRVDFNKGIFEYLPAEDDAKEGEDCEALYAEFEAPGSNVF